MVFSSEQYRHPVLPIFATCHLPTAHFATAHGRLALACLSLPWLALACLGFPWHSTFDFPELSRAFPSFPERSVQGFVEGLVGTNYYYYLVPLLLLATTTRTPYGIRPVLLERTRVCGLFSQSDWHRTMAVCFFRILCFAVSFVTVFQH